MAANEVVSSEAAEPEDAHHAHFDCTQIFVYLCLLTTASFVVQWIPRGMWGTATNMLFVLLVATCKASLVLGYFMHLRYEKMWKWFVTLPATILAVTILCALLPDIAYPVYQQIAWSYGK